MKKLGIAGFLSLAISIAGLSLLEVESMKEHAAPIGLLIIAGLIVFAFAISAIGIILQNRVLHHRVSLGNVIKKLPNNTKLFIASILSPTKKK